VISLLSLGLLALISARFDPVFAVIALAFLAPLAAGWLWFFRRKHSNRGTALFVLSNMALMAVIGLTFALITVQDRRKNDRKGVPPPPPPVPQAVSPAELPALGYLPPDTQLAAGIHVAEARRTFAGSKFLSRFRFGNTTAGVADLERWTGLEPENIDHLVFGLKMDEKGAPRLVLVAQSRRPYDEAKVRKALHANRSSSIGQRTVWSFTPEKLTLDALLWCAGPQTLVIGLSKADIEAVPITPAAGPERLAAPLQAFLKERMGRGSQAWLAGHVERWEALQPWLAIMLPAEDRATVASLRTFGFWLELDQGAVFHGAIRCVDEPAAEALEKKLAAMKMPRNLSFLAPAAGAEKGDQPLDPEALIGELTQTLKREQQGAWVTIRASASAATLRKTLGE